MDFKEIELTIGRFVVQNLEEAHYIGYAIEIGYMMSYLFCFVMSIFPNVKCDRSLERFNSKTTTSDYLIQAIFCAAVTYVFTFERAKSYLKFFPMAASLFYVGLAFWELLFDSPIKKFHLGTAPGILKTLFWGMVSFLHYNIVVGFFHFSKFPRENTPYVLVMGGLLALFTLMKKEALIPLYQVRRNDVPQNQTQDENKKSQ